MNIQSNSPNRKMVFIAATVITVLLYLTALSNRYKPTPDSSEYLGLAGSMAQGNGYQFNGQQGSFYPPLLPLTLAGIIKMSTWAGVASSSILLMKLLQVILMVLLMAGSRRLALRYLSETRASLVALLLGANLVVFQHCMFILSDILFGCLFVWALVLLDERKNWRQWSIGSILLGAAWLTRSVGLVLVSALVLWLFLGRFKVWQSRQRWSRAILAFALAVLPFALWILCQGKNDNYYLTWYQTLTGESTPLGIFWNRLTAMSTVVPLRSAQILLNIESMPLGVWFGVSVLLVAVIGWWRSFLKKRSLPEFCTLFYAGMLLLWFDQGPRFYIPILGLLLIYAMKGLEWLEGAAQHAVLRSGVRLGLILVLSGLAWPLWNFFVGDAGSPGIVTFLRGGYIYSLLALLIITLGALRMLGDKIALPVNKIMYVSFLAIYIGIGWLYSGTYSVIEHRLIESRGPMLCGYQPYYDMGKWLKEQEGLDEPILCAYDSIVHLGSGRLTKGTTAQPEQILQKLRQGDYAAVAVLDQPSLPAEADDQTNAQLREIVHDYQETFAEVQSASKNGCTYYLYKYVPSTADLSH